MNNTLNSIFAGVKKMQQNQDGTIQGGYLSVTNGRYRIMVTDDPGNPSAIVWDNTSCTGENKGCKNQACPGSHNTKGGFLDCINGSCIAISSPGGQSIRTIKM